MIHGVRDRRTVLQGLCGVSVIALTGCGGGESSPPVTGGGPAPTPSPTPTPVPTPTPTPTYGEVPTRPSYQEQQSFLPGSPYTVGVAISVYVDAESGSDGNPGTQSAPVRTMDRARELAPDSGVIGLRRGQTHFRDQSSTLSVNVTQSVVGYGNSVLPATVSGGQPAGGFTFSAQGAGVFRTTLILAEEHVAGGSGLSNTSTTYPFVRDGENYFEWFVGGATIADNLAALSASNGPGFCINVAGSSVPDVRDEPAGRTTFDLYVKTAAGSDPSGDDLVVMAFFNAYKWAGELLQDICIRDAWSKDTTGTAPKQPNIPLLRRVQTLGGGCHGWVGSCNVDGYRSRGVARPGMNGFEQGRSAGGGLNLFTSIDRAGERLTINGLEIENFNIALYGHTSGTTDFVADRITVAKANQSGFTDFKIRNCATVVAIDPKGTQSVAPGGLDINCQVDIVDVDTVLKTEGRTALNAGGTVIFAADTVRNYLISDMRVAAADHTFKSIVFYPPKPTSLSFGVDMVRVRASDTASPALRFDNCELPTNPDYSFLIGRKNEGEGKVNLTVTGATVMGDPIIPGVDRYPSALTANGNSVLAFADQQSRQALRDLLISVGTEQNISNTITLLRSDGAVAEPAG